MRFARIPNPKPITALAGNFTRIQFIGAILFCLTLILGARLAQLHISDTEFLRKQGNARTLHTVEIPSYRGMITDRRGSPLAVSTPVVSLWIHPKHFAPSKEGLQQLSQLLNIPSKQILEKKMAYANKSFAYLQRNVTPDLANKIRDLGILGLGFKREFRRYYPAGKEVAQLIGFTNIDDQGQTGLELAYDSILKAQPGKKRVLEDRAGRWAEDVENIQVPKAGKDLTLSIDLRIQALALRELNEAITIHQAKSATVVMLDTTTGEVLCMVSAP
ncbi:MAG TPA: penicillin-binding protein 2, partial [Gammaproteobacteria bacterium]|nr:penicillin-binding protein 2 [Gammaproteobacteria bacterium]